MALLDYLLGATVPQRLPPPAPRSLPVEDDHWQFNDDAAAGLSTPSAIELHKLLPRVIGTYPVIAMRQAVRPIFYDDKGNLKEDAKGISIRFALTANEVTATKSILGVLRDKNREQFDEAALGVFAEHIRHTTAFDRRHFDADKCRAIAYRTTIGAQIVTPNKLRAGFPHSDLTANDYSRIYIAVPFAPMTQFGLSDDWRGGTENTLKVSNSEQVLMDGQTMHSSAPLPANARPRVSMMLHITAEFF